MIVAKLGSSQTGGLEGAACKRGDAFTRDEEEMVKESRFKRQG